MKVTFDSMEGLAGFGFWIALIGGVWLFLVHVAFAIGLWRDGDGRRQKGMEVAFVGPGTWAVSVLVGSFLVVALYWAIHYSTLRASPSQSKP